MASAARRSAGSLPANRGLVVVGTASDVGKSFVVTGLCRLLTRRGYAVQPFKAVNMSLNSIPTAAGEEIALAQWVQCVAARVAPSALANPVLLKPYGSGVEVVVRGRSRLALASWRREMPRHLPRLREEVRRAVEDARNSGRSVVAEGAGSPVELNLRSSDLSNFFVAELLDAPVLLVADLDRGGALAQVVGTWELLAPSERARVRGIIFNRFRGDPELFRPAVAWTADRLGVPVIGVVPMLPATDGRLPPEDSLQLGRPPVASRAAPPRARLGIVRLPHTANFSDFAELEARPELATVWVEQPSEAVGLDALLLPGTRRTGDDLAWLRRLGWPAAIAHARRHGVGIGGVCGGFQLLGDWLDDPSGTDGRPGRHRGLGLLPVTTRFRDPKLVRPVRAVALARHPWLPEGWEVACYEIHRGRIEGRGPSWGIFRLRTDDRSPPAGVDGAVSADGRVWGTMLHGALSSPKALDGLVQWATPRRRAAERGPARRSRRPTDAPELFPDLDRTIDRVADLLERHLDQRALFKIFGAAARPSRRADPPGPARQPSPG